MFDKVTFCRIDAPVLLFCENCAFKLPSYEEIEWSMEEDQTLIEKLPVYELEGRRFKCPAKNCEKILKFDEFKEKSCCEAATNPLFGETKIING